MGSPLAPVLTNLFLSHHEGQWLKESECSRVLKFKRYVDDIFCVFESEDEVQPFFEFINNRQSNIKFTIEKEVNKKLPFLDILIEFDKKNNKSNTSTYYKKTYTGLLTNFNSFTSFSYKTGLVRTLFDRAFKINSSWTGFHSDAENIKKTLQKNSFPKILIDKIFKTTVDKKIVNQKLTSDTTSTRFYKLPYIGSYSSVAQQQLMKILSKYCKDIKIKIIFTPFKIGCMFSLKDSTTDSMKSCVVYKFSCSGCNAC